MKTPETHVTPSIGRIVWYRGQDNIVRAAIVTHVWSQFLIDLHAFGKDQNDPEAGIHTSVTHGDIEHEPSCCPSWSWMPYQKGQAAKTEQLESALAEAGKIGAINDEDLLEQLFWNYDDQRKKSGQERLSFKDALRTYLFKMSAFGKDDQLSFGQAIFAMKAGHRVCRAGWNGKGMWLTLSCDGSRQVPAESFWSPHNAQFARENGGSATVQPCITMKNAQGQIQMGWNATQSDMLADDWMILNAPQIVPLDAVPTPVFAENSLPGVDTDDLSPHNTINS